MCITCDMLLTVDERSVPLRHARTQYQQVNHNTNTEYGCMGQCETARSIVYTHGQIIHSKIQEFYKRTDIHIYTHSGQTPVHQHRMHTPQHIYTPGMGEHTQNTLLCIRIYTAYIRPSTQSSVARAIFCFNPQPTAQHSLGHQVPIPPMTETCKRERAVPGVRVLRAKYKVKSTHYKNTYKDKVHSAPRPLESPHVTAAHVTRFF